MSSILRMDRAPRSPLFFPVKSVGVRELEDRRGVRIEEVRDPLYVIDREGNRTEVEL